MDKAPTHVDLFSGIGGFALAAQWAGFRTIAFCEIDKYCQKVLAKNFLADSECERNGDERPRATAGTATEMQGEVGEQRIRVDVGECASPRIFSNIFDFDGTAYRGCDLLTGGFPCQPFSVAGKRRGAADDRHLWPEMLRVIKEARPAWVLGENVPGIIPMELDNVLSDLEGIGYACRPFVIPACAVDAKHRRDRLWIIGRRIIEFLPDADEQGLEGRSQTGSNGSIWARSDDQFPYGLHCGNATERNRFTQWEPEPDVGRSINGLSRWLDKTGLSDEAKDRATEIVRYVWSNDVAQAFQWNFGRFDGMEETEVLLAFLCQYEEASDGSWTQVESRANALTILRSVWREIESARASYRCRYFKQLAREYSDALRKLSCKTSSLYPQAWSGGCWEDGILRVAHGVPDRVERLKGLGNAVVPQVAYEILHEIRRLI